ncbi:hypothetical protein GGR56DRAFT_81 [Xylariaceae sp. FL0804]|nr:hypothetical protein GGR56DRAFT_81 [Xylariaceae sp. FL0804]
MVNDTVRAPFGHRLLPHIVDDLASTKPNQDCFSIPRSSEPKGGWEPVTFRSYATVVNFLAHHVVQKCGRPQSDAFPTLAYIGPNDARYCHGAKAKAKA